MLTVGVVVSVWGPGVYGISMYFLLYFSVNVKLLQKK